MFSQKLTLGDGSKAGSLIIDSAEKTLAPLSARIVIP
jgi:hypothetical protein